MSFLQQFSADLTALVAQAAPAVVGVQHRQGQGSGFLISPDGFVLTNNHVVRNARCTEVRFRNGKVFEAEAPGTDAATDLAVLRTQTANLPYLNFAHDVAPLVGTPVVAIGNPYRFEGSVSFGVVSALGRSLAVLSGPALENLVQTDAAVNPGNSGGPLVDAWGRVAGVTTAVVTSAQGIGFAVPAATAHWVAGHLVQRGAITRPYVGVAGRAEDLPRALAHNLEQARALRVVRVEAGTPAERAGLQPGDLLLRSGGAELGSVDDLQRQLVVTAGQEIELEPFRKGRRHLSTLVPSPPRPRVIESAPSHPRVLN